ncbi:FAD binding domain-containing protein [Pterulicium gracile]|uniref:FAD binding domain-containing protein n=1 Tax=Pterulicium gracile TaxID=1884261 RepID=A0A5C3QYG1_9AGAR|nr:FAD binding domain-containing protein [Pterula gracilis]
MEQTNATQVDVLIVGAGPAGLVCANALATSGIRVKIIDHKPERVSGHADGVMPRTTEIIHSYGLGADFMEQGSPAHTIAFYNTRADGGGIENTNHVPFIHEDDTRWRYCVTLHQGAIEKLFVNSMAKKGVTVDRPVRPVSIQVSKDPAVLRDRNAYPVTISLENLNSGEEPEIVHAKFVLGGDGAHSWIRKQLGISMDGEATSRVWGAFDFKPAQVPNVFPDWRHVATVVAGDHTILLIPREKEKIRCYIELGDAATADVEGGRREPSKRTGPEELTEVAKKAFHPFSIAPAHVSDVEWYTNYIIGQRVASKFSVGERAFIAGDACHTHSPKGGQGMNVSMNDSHNLAWKLAYFIKGWADHSILGTYELERRPVAQALIDFDKWYSAGYSAKARAEYAKANGGVAPEPMEGFRRMSGFTSGVGITYQPSILVSETPSVDSAASKLVLGRRLPPRVLVRIADCHPLNLQDECPSDGRFKILVFTGDLTDSAQAERVATAATALAGPQGLLRSFPDFEGMFDILPIVKGVERKTPYTRVPSELWSHWSKVFVDEPSRQDAEAGICYESFGISPEKGAIVVVRPDAHVGIAAHLDAVKDVEAYFSGFLLKST